MIFIAVSMLLNSFRLCDVYLTVRIIYLAIRTSFSLCNYPYNHHYPPVKNTVRSKWRLINSGLSRIYIEDNQLNFTSGRNSSNIQVFFSFLKTPYRYSWADPGGGGMPPPQSTKILKGLESLVSGSSTSSQYPPMKKISSNHHN